MPVVTQRKEVDVEWTIEAMAEPYAYHVRPHAHPGQRQHRRTQFTQHLYLSWIDIQLFIGFSQRRIYKRLVRLRLHGFRTRV